ncbi:hypothetical protein K2173_028009 [Erythroxylum novogranatense]|uniref:Uncharacterized protein n=1 Tax=Erythroxylum novogranatense TaxID=1862640 RepID=A0AAV8U0P9_9ROSI|nr:hypothetical protein K2173_028009 [Erythroxylum novogranatense]
MGVFHQEEPPNPSKKCKFLVATLKDVFSNCSTGGGRLSNSSPEHDYPATDFDDEQEIIVSEIRSRIMERSRQRSFVLTDSFSWVYSPKTGELFVTPKASLRKGNDQNEEDESEDNERDEFFSVGSCFSCCSSALSRETFMSVKTNFSRCFSDKGLEFRECPRRSIILEFCHCEGWPFGLCKKAVLLPPLPKSPSESWSWRKGARIVKMSSTSSI